MVDIMNNYKVFGVKIPLALEKESRIPPPKYIILLK